MIHFKHSVAVKRRRDNTSKHLKIFFKNGKQQSSILKDPCKEKVSTHVLLSLTYIS